MIFGPHIDQSKRYPNPQLTGIMVVGHWPSFKIEILGFFHHHHEISFFKMCSKKIQNFWFQYFKTSLYGRDCKQILAQQPFLVEASPFGISRHICFFYDVGLADQCPQPISHEGKP
jgi:hypothetical protein